MSWTEFLESELFTVLQWIGSGNASRVNAEDISCRIADDLPDKRAPNGVRASIAPSAVGLGALVMVGVGLDRSTPEGVSAFEEAVDAMKEVKENGLLSF